MDRGAGDLDGESLEPFVDVHAFTPDELGAWARGAGFEDVEVRGEELLANWFGWMNRTLEATAHPEDVPWLWRQYAFAGTCCSSAWTSRCSKAACPRRSSTTS